LTGGKKRAITPRVAHNNDEARNSGNLYDDGLVGWLDFSGFW
jgi:hypothetical protein